MKAELSMADIGPEPMHFFDCNVFVGSPAYQRPLLPVPTAGALLAGMDRAGVDRALVWHIAQHDASPQAGNRLVVEAIRPHERLTGCWAVLPTQTGELAPAPLLFRQMREARVGALRIFPSAHKFVANGVSLGALFGELVDRRIPLFVSVRRGMDWPDVYALLEDFPDLVCVICDHGSWGMDRLFRPLLERYQNVHVDTSQYLLDGGIDDLVAVYGERRLLFGSGFPESYFGGIMLALRHARISEQAKAAVAAGNLERLLAGAEL